MMCSGPACPTAWRSRAASCRTARQRTPCSGTTITCSCGTARRIPTWVRSASQVSRSKVSAVLCDHVWRSLQAARRAELLMSHNRCSFALDYCSRSTASEIADAAGERDVTWPDGSKWLFRGRHIRDAVVMNLLADHGLAGTCLTLHDHGAESPTPDQHRGPAKSFPCGG